MARLRKSEPPVSNEGDVPAALKDHDSPVWADRGLFREWCTQHLGRVLKPHGQDVYFRFTAAVEAWSVVNGYMRPNQPSAVDYERLKPSGITQIRSLERARLRSVGIRDTWHGGA